MLVLLVVACRSRNEEPAIHRVVPRDAGSAATTAVAVDAHIDARTATIREWLATKEPRFRALPALQRKAKRGDCRTSYAPRPERDPNPMCKVDGGTFSFGEGAEAKQVTLGPFLIDQFEVSAAQAAAFLNARGSNECPGLDERPAWLATREISCVGGVGEWDLTEHEGVYTPFPGFERVSVTGFSFEGAMQYCAWVGKQVPSAAQREFAGRHDPMTGRDLRFPWGDDWRPNHASCWHNTECKAPPKPRHGKAWIGVFDGTKGRGDGSSPWGLHDIVGGSSERVFVCDDPEATCEPGEPCSCSPENDFADKTDLELMKVSVRSPSGSRGSSGVRCLLRLDNR